MTLRPICAVCHRAVEAFVTEEDAFMQRVTFTARCHGETQRVVLDMAEVASGPVFIGKAFDDEPKRLPR